MKVGILDYGAGNLKNVCRAVEYLGYSYQLVSSEKEVLSVDKIIIPGVGAFKVAMDQLTKMGLVETIKTLADRKVPILGICLGMQILFEESSEFGATRGLGLLQGKVSKIPSTGASGSRLKVPHIGWNELILDNPALSLTREIQTGDPFYFVHSYRASGYITSDLIGHCMYDGHILPAIVGHDNVYGCQFHPEKSGRLGLKILLNFLREMK